MDHLYGKKLCVPFYNDAGNMIVPAYRRITKTIIRDIVANGIHVPDSAIHDHTKGRAEKREAKQLARLVYLESKALKISDDIAALKKLINGAD
jgi:hypothetical protein